MKLIVNIFLGLFLLGWSSNDLFAQNCLKLIWADKFDGTSLDNTKWNYDIGNGCPDLCGWGNNEQQYYTDATENVKVEITKSYVFIMFLIKKHERI